MVEHRSPKPGVGSEISAARPYYNRFATIFIASAGKAVPRPASGLIGRSERWTPYAGTMINRAPHLNFQRAVPPASLGAYLIAR